MAAQPHEPLSGPDLDAAIAHLSQIIGGETVGNFVLAFIRKGAGGKDEVIHRALSLQRADWRAMARKYIERYAGSHDCYLSVARFGDDPAGKVSRTVANMIGSRWVLCDLDDKSIGAAVPPASIEVETSAGRRQLYYRLAEPLDATAIKDLNIRIARACGCGNEAVDAVHLLRLPGTFNRKPTRNGAIVAVVRSEPDNRYTPADFAHLPPPPPRPGPAPVPQLATGGRVAARLLVERALDRLAGADREGRNNRGFWLAAQLRDNGYNQEETIEIMAEQYQPRVPPANPDGVVEPYTTEEMLRTIDSAYTQQPREPWRQTRRRIRAREAAGSLHLVTEDGDAGCADTLPAIDAGNHDLPDVAGRAWDALKAWNRPPRLFLHADAPVRMEESADGEPVLAALTEKRMRYEVARAADWYVRKGKDQVEVGAEPPLAVIQDMLATPLPPLPVLRRIATTPIFAPDGRLIKEPGFDAESGIHLCPAPGVTLPHVPAEPTEAEIQAARSLICDDLLADFPFADDGDKAAAVALFLLGFVREMIPGLTPLHGIESPQAGSGKGLLADACTRAAFGSFGGSLTEASSNDEWRKQIGAKLRAGAPILRFDNIAKPLDSAALASALTAPVFEDRLLGQNAAFKAPARCIWLYTANNPVMSTEIARRTVRIRLDAKEARPWERTGFRHPNLSLWMDDHRGDLIGAALTLIRAWLVAGRPLAAVTLGSYELWAATMGGILDVAGVPGFLTNLADFYEAADIEGGAWRELIAAWRGKHESDKVTAHDLFTLTYSVDGFDFGNGSEKAQRTSFGMQLAKQRDRIYDGYHIKDAGKFHNKQQWQLVRLD